MKNNTNQSIKLSDLQLLVMKVLWKNGKLSVSETQKLLSHKKKMAVTTVATLLKRMYEKNIVAFEKQGRQFLYYPLVSQSEVKSSMLSNLLGNFFDGNPLELVHHLVSKDEVSKSELDKIKALIEQSSQGEKR